MLHVPPISSSLPFISLNLDGFSGAGTRSRAIKIIFRHLRSLFLLRRQTRPEIWRSRGTECKGVSFYSATQFVAYIWGCLTTPLHYREFVASVDEWLTEGDLEGNGHPRIFLQRLDKATRNLRQYSWRRGVQPRIEHHRHTVPFSVVMFSARYT
jgi:hypothetical protein